MLTGWTFTYDSSASAIEAAHVQDPCSQILGRSFALDARMNARVRAHVSLVETPRMIAQRRIIVHCIALGSAILLLGAPIAFDGPNANAAPSLPAPCVLGDGYKVKSGASIKVYPVRCPTNCFDAPNGGPIEKQLFCKDGTLGISDPTLTADGTVAPYEVASQYNGPGHCTALPSHPGWWDKWGQSADRKTCVKL